MRTMPIHDHDPRDYPDFIEGFPEPKSVTALCLPCYAIHEVGTYRYENEPIELEDGSTTTFEDWKREYERNSVSRTGSKRRKFHCPRCDFLTDHVAEV